MREWVTGAVAFAVCIAFVPGWPDGSLAPRWAVLSIAVPVLLCCVGRVRASPGLYLLAAFVGFAGLSLAWTPAVLDGLYLFWPFCLMLGIFCLPACPKAAYLGACLALIPNSIVTALQFWGFQPFETIGLNPGIFFNKSFSAEISAMVAIGLIGTARWWLAPAVLVPLGLLPLSRGAIIAFGTGIWLLLAKKQRFAAALIAILLVGLFVRLVLAAPHMNNSFERVALWADTARSLTFFGHGLGSFRWAYPYFEYAHNDLLQVAYELGVPGVLLIGAFFVYCLRAGALTERLVMVVFLVEGCFGFPLFTPATLGLVSLVAGSLCRSRLAVDRPVSDRERAVLPGENVEFPHGDRGSLPAMR